MRRNGGNENQADTIRAPSREEIETLCFLHVVGTSGCRVEDLAHRLGVSSDITDALGRCAGTLSQRGLVVVDGDNVSVTDVGRDWMRSRLAELGVRT